MLQTIEQRETVDVGKLLAGAAKTIASVRCCWLATASEAGPPGSGRWGEFRPIR
jgi:hypothetical protein